MKPLLILLFLTACIFPFLNCDIQADNKTVSENETADSLKKTDSLNRILTFSKVDSAKSFCKANKFNTDFCFLLNMKIHSGLHRFYIYDFSTKTLIDSGLVSHGCGSKPWSMGYSAENPVFSNTPESHTSSLGKYKIGKRDYSQWGVGIKYYLHGLESSNSKAYDRQIVFHSWDAITDDAIYPIGSAEGWGCPAISDNFFRRVDEKLKASEKPVLLWMFNK